MARGDQVQHQDQGQSPQIAQPLSPASLEMKKAAIHNRIDWQSVRTIMREAYSNASTTALAKRILIESITLHLGWDAYCTLSPPLRTRIITPFWKRWSDAAKAAKCKPTSTTAKQIMDSIVKGHDRILKAAFPYRYVLMQPIPRSPPRPKDTPYKPRRRRTQTPDSIPSVPVPQDPNKGKVRGGFAEAVALGRNCPKSTLPLMPNGCVSITQADPEQDQTFGDLSCPTPPELEEKSTTTTTVTSYGYESGETPLTDDTTIETDNTDTRPAMSRRKALGKREQEILDLQQMNRQLREQIRTLENTCEQLRARIRELENIQGEAPNGQQNAVRNGTTNNRLRPWNWHVHKWQPKVRMKWRRKRATIGGIPSGSHAGTSADSTQLTEASPNVSRIEKSTSSQ